MLQFYLRIPLGDEPGLPVNMVVNDGGRASNGKRSRQHAVGRQVEHGLDFRGQFVAEIQEPAAVKRQLRHPAGAFVALPPVVERCKESLCCVLVPTTQLAVSAQHERLARAGEQDVVAPQRRPRRRALQQERVTLRQQPVETKQIDRLRQRTGLQIVVGIPPVHGGRLSRTL